MKLAVVSRCVSAILLVVGATMLTAVPVGMVMGDSGRVITQFLVAAGITLVVGACGVYLNRKADQEIGIREGFGIVAFSWVIASLFSALPLILGIELSIIDACFESMSGLTTTGATILPQIDDLPKSILYWRAMIHWMGGMGIVVLSLAIMPILGIGGMQLYKSEVPGPSSDRLAPRVTSTAKILWTIYFLLTIAATIAFRITSMSWFDAWCHACSAIATGGFSTHTASIGHFQSAYVDVVVTAFMFLGGANFVLHLRAMRGQPLFYFRDEEFRIYFGIIIAAVMACSAVLYSHKFYDGNILTILRHASFSVISIITTTGFCTEDFDQWPMLAKILIFTFMFVGGCAGSTSGGMKMSRMILICKFALAQLRQCIYPNSVRNIRLNNLRVHDSVMVKVLGFCLSFLLLIGVVTLITCAIEPDFDVFSEGGRGFETAVSGAVAMVGNIGPGLAHIGPSANFSWLSDGSKIVYVFAMLAGRLELFTLMVLFLPGFWKH